MSWKKINIKDSGEIIVDKINELPIEEDFQIDLEHIKGLVSLLDDLKKKWTSRPIFGGGRLSKMSLDQHFIDDETPTNSGDDTNFTITHSPNPVSSLKIYRNGQRIRKTEDFTFVGQTITLLTSLSAGEILLVDYKK